MSGTKYLQGPCSHCGAPIKYAAHMVGTTAQCPRCGQITELLLERPPEEPTIPRRIIYWTLAAVLILLLGLGGTLYALKRTERWVQENKRPAATNSPAAQ